MTGSRLAAAGINLVVSSSENPMRREFLSRSVSVLLVAALACVGCSSRRDATKPDPDSAKPVNPNANPKLAAGSEPILPPAELVGKWRMEVGDGKSTRTTVYNFTKDGRFEVETHLVMPTLNTTDRVRRTMLKVEKDHITFVDIAHVGAEGVEDVIPADRLRPRTAQFRVQDDKLHWTPVSADGKPAPGAQPMILKRVKE